MSPDAKVEDVAEAELANIPDVCMALGAERARRGMSLADVATALKLTQRQVEAMETGKFELLPGAAFVRGFLRNYCRLLELDADALLKTFPVKASRTNAELTPVSNATGTVPTGVRGRPSIRPLIVLALVGFFVIIFGAYFDWFKQVPETHLAATPAQPNVVPSLPPPVVSSDNGGLVLAPPKLEVVADVPTAVPAPAVVTKNGSPEVMAKAPSVVPAASSAPAVVVDAARDGKAALVFEFSGESWIEVRDAGGAIVYSGVNAAGSRREVAARAPLSLVIGNAASVHLTRDGKPIEFKVDGKSAVARITLP